MPGLMDTLKHGPLRKTRRPLEMVVLLVLLTATGLPLTVEALNCHVCEEENSLNCTNPQTCSDEQKFCVMVAARLLERFYISSKQCTKTCLIPPYFPPAPEESSDAGPPQPKNFVVQKPLPFLYSKCCKWDLCNQHGPHLLYYKEQPGKASERRHRHTELFLPGFMVLIAAVLTALSLQ
ncbi:lymphocyte antigen 6K [Peromyscus eremicus]|uniref:lymphocyte antigen 6K n=1 Tax=Peromyscus eremicus TaxID=42410 RepID=UPI0027DD80CC|nr:lymphocyte antigen 6K [Peromyscus eremicus]